MEFQSLFWWILYYDQSNAGYNIGGGSFNPCFGGSYIMTRTFCGWGKCRIIVSILVLVDLILWHYILDISWYRLSWFQSLFWWILYYDPRSRLMGVWPLNMFQSLFWWILYYDYNTSTCVSADTVFQSLFWWILYYDKVPLLEDFSDLYSFNPCFGGSYIMTLAKVLLKP